MRLLDRLERFGSLVARDRIFDRFSRGTAGGHRSDGAGLGLSIVSAIASAHGGRVDLDSVPGRGATFTLVIPAMKGTEGTEGEPWRAS